MGKKIVDDLELVGKLFGRWKVLSIEGKDKNNKTMYLCECRCVKKTKKLVSKYSLLDGMSKSCGCIQKEQVDLVGKKFGKLTVLHFDQEKHDEGKNKGKNWFYWVCECNCKENDKNIISVQRSNLTRGYTTSCGCAREGCGIIDLTGQVFEKLKVIRYDHTNKKGEACWLCDCECGNQTIISGSSLSGGYTKSCGCLVSAMENDARKYFDNINIDYIQQHTYDDCIYKDKLKFDFYLPDYNCCVEFDGKQHFEPVDFSGKNPEQAKENFRLTQIRDEIKKEFCSNNNIKLIRIPYWDFDNYKNILFKELGIGGETCL